MVIVFGFKNVVGYSDELDWRSERKMIRGTNEKILVLLKE